MQVWNVLHADRWKYRTQKFAKNLPSAHHRTNLLGYIFATTAYTDNRKQKLLNSNIFFTCSYNMVNFGPLAAEIGSQVWGTPANFNGFCILASLLQRRRSTKVNQALHDLWLSPGLELYIHFRGLLPPNGTLPGAKFTLHLSLMFSYIRSVTARRWSGGCQPNVAAFSRGRHLYSGGRPLRWASTHILVQ